jgi:ABC-type multidrug transport system fused ATPase/permease subunit
LAGGKTAIYISHRLSSCKFCDNIAVFSEGTIKEFGNHNQLMKLENGVYQQMFTTQAKQYKK